MTELQIGLIGLGAIAVVGVLAYNKWQEYRHRKLAEQVLNVRHTDVLLNETADADAGMDFSDVGEENVFTREDLAGETNDYRAEVSEPSERIEPVFRIDPEPREPTMTYPEPAAESVATESPTAQAPIPVRHSDEVRDIPEPHHLL